MSRRVAATRYEKVADILRVQRSVRNGRPLALINVDTVIANGAECDPLLQCDQRLMESRAAEMVRGVLLALEATSAICTPKSPILPYSPLISIILFQFMV